VGGSVVEVEGVVTQLLPRALCRVRIDAHREVIAHAATGPGRNFVRLIVGDRVIVQVSSHDLGRGRVVRRLAGG
jgi:translation initiation factor IF-1